MCWVSVTKKLSLAGHFQRYHFGICSHDCEWSNKKLLKVWSWSGEWKIKRSSRLSEHVKESRGEMGKRKEVPDAIWGREGGCWMAPDGSGTTHETSEPVESGKLTLHSEFLSWEREWEHIELPHIKVKIWVICNHHAKHNSHYSLGAPNKVQIPLNGVQCFPWFDPTNHFSLVSHISSHKVHTSSGILTVCPKLILYVFLLFLS